MSIKILPYPYIFFNNTYILSKIYKVTMQNLYILLVLLSIIVALRKENITNIIKTILSFHNMVFIILVLLYNAIYITI